MKNYSEISGVVCHGFANGRKVGMPTANIEYECDNETVADGVYATEVVLLRNNEDGSVVRETYLGVTNIGNRPTVDDVKTIETNILDFNEDIYGKTIKLIVIKRIRDIKKFDSLEQLKLQVDKDNEFARIAYKEYKEEK